MPAVLWVVGIRIHHWVWFEPFFFMLDLLVPPGVEHPYADRTRDQHDGDDHINEDCSGHEPSSESDLRARYPMGLRGNWLPGKSGSWFRPTRRCSWLPCRFGSAAAGLAQPG